MNASDKCRVDDCDRRAAASMIRENLPGPLPLCAAHTEDYRLNGSEWNIAWEQARPEPTSVSIGATAEVGRGTTASDQVPAAVPRIKFRFSLRRGNRL